MRLTVHVEDAKKRTEEKNTKDGVVRKKKTYTTLSYSNVHKEDVQNVLSQIKKDELGTPTKHYLSAEKIPGISRKKKKIK